MPTIAFDEALPQAVLASVGDPARLCPVFSGPVLLAGDRMTLRTGAADMEVHAPARLMGRAFGLCDGSRTLEEVLDTAALVPDLAGFVCFLLAEGVLVDASLLSMKSAAHARQGSRLGLPARRDCTARIGSRFRAGTASLPEGTRTVEHAPLGELFERRISSWSFAPRALPEESLLQLLWSVAGVVRASHERLGDAVPRRTLASAGAMHLLRVHVALQQPTGGYAAGVYRVLYPAQKAVALAPVDARGPDLPGAFIDASQLRNATGALFLSADAQVAALRYRNRSLQYLYMEAGAALHNAALTAPPLDMAFVTVGGYSEDAVEALCGLQGQMVLGAGLFGPALTTAPSPP